MEGIFKITNESPLAFNDGVAFRGVRTLEKLTKPVLSIWHFEKPDTYSS